MSEIPEQLAVGALVNLVRARVAEEFPMLSPRAAARAVAGEAVTLLVDALVAQTDPADAERVAGGLLKIVAFTLGCHVSLRPEAERAGLLRVLKHEINEGALDVARAAVETAQVVH